MISPHQLTDPGKAAIGRLVLVDADMALLFMRMAWNTSDSTLKERRLKAAARAYERIITFLPRVSLTTEQLTVLGRKLSTLRSCLRPGIVTWAEA